MNDELIPSAPQQSELLADMSMEPIEIREEMERLGLIGPHIKAKELVDETFIIFGAKSFKSMGGESEIAYFCNCTDEKRQEVWTTVLGGQAVVDMLEKYIAASIGKPVKVTLRWVEGGSYGGYYVIE